jgi:hypothetical protein
MSKTTPIPSPPSADSGAALARAAALMQIAGRERTLIQAGRTRVSLVLALASAATWGYAAFAVAAVLR